MWKEVEMEAEEEMWPVVGESRLISERKRTRASSESGQEEEERVVNKEKEQLETGIERIPALIVRGDTLENCDQYEFSESLSAKVGEVAGRVLRTGSYLLRPSTKEQYKKLVAITQVGGHSVVIEEYKPVMVVRGIVRGVPRKYSIEKLKKAWATQGAAEVEYLNSLKFKEAEERDLEHLSRTVLITFNIEKVPERMKFGFETYRVEIYERPPIRCYSCQRFGHIAKVCRGSVRCGRCAGTHDAKECPEGTRVCCCNCRGAHAATDKRCPARETAQAVVKEVMKTGARYTDVHRKIVQSKQEAGRLFSEVAQKGRQAESSKVIGGDQSEFRKQVHVPDPPVAGTAQALSPMVLPILKGLLDLLSNVLPPKGAVVMALRTAIRQLNG